MNEAWHSRTVSDERSRPVPPEAWGAISAFLLLTFVLSWLPALLVRPLWQVGTGRWITRLLAASSLYGGTMGWQPLVAALAVNRWFIRRDAPDSGARPAPPRFALLGIAGPLALMIASATIGWLAARVPGGASAPMLALAEPEVARAIPSPALAALLFLALALTIAVLYLQCFSEEYGWRGFFLAMLMREIGPRRGLVLHGAIWGLWYAPPFLLAGDQIHRGALRCVAFVFTCTLLGVTLGWLRLASKSIMPAVFANGLLTISCGLPFILQNVDVGLRGAAYTPLGWLPLIGVGLVLLFGKWRAVIATPSRDQDLSSVILLLRRPTQRADHDRLN